MALIKHYKKSQNKSFIFDTALAIRFTICIQNYLKYMMSSLKMLLFLLLGHFILLSLLANVAAAAAGGVFKMQARKHKKMIVVNHNSKFHHPYHESAVVVPSLLLLTNSSTTVENGSSIFEQPMHRSGYYYTTTISLGTPAQEFNVLLDTGSALFWLSLKHCCIVKEECKSIKFDGDHGCSFEKVFHNSTKCCLSNTNHHHQPAKKRRFDPIASNTYKNATYKFDSCYANAKFTSGYWSHDSLTFNPSDNDQNASSSLMIANASFGLVTSMDSVTDAVPFDGIIGLGYNEELEHGFVGPLHQAVEQGLLDENMFTVYLPPKNVYAGVNGNDEGYFTFGGLDSQNCGPVIGWAPVKDKHLQAWVFEIESISFGENASRLSANNLLFATSDTGAPLVGVDAETLDAILETIINVTHNININASGNYTYILPCDADYPPVVFHIAGQNYTLGKEYLTIHDESLVNGTCGFGMQTQLPWTLGEPFIRKYCQVHDFGNSRIGFAEAKQ